VIGGLKFSMVDVGRFHSCGVTVDGLVHCWGAGEEGQLGTGMLLDQPTPVPVQDPAFAN
jgi:hypothetical protein